MLNSSILQLAARRAINKIQAGIERCLIESAFIIGMKTNHEQEVCVAGASSSAKQWKTIFYGKFDTKRKSIRIKIIGECP
jgi:hypothetical protein